MVRSGPHTEREQAVVSAAADPTNDMVDKFVASQRKLADKAYKLLYSDGLGIDGEPAPAFENFVENYVVEALNRETKAILKAKGFATELPPEPNVPLSESFKDVEKKDSPQTLEGQIEQLSVQKQQKRAVRERVREGKTLEVMAPQVDMSKNHTWEVTCGEPINRRHAYDAIPGCSPGTGTGSLVRLPCQRFVSDGFATELEQAHMLVAMDRGLRGLFHQGSETLLVPEADSKGRLGEAGFRLTAQLLERVRATIMEALNISHQIFYSGSLLKRMDYPPIEGEMQLELSHDSSNPHVDKANIVSYDYSALLYFNSVGEDFGGGELLFTDADADRMVPPLAGRLVAFTSGMENLHKVLPMTWGRRYVLSTWFTCSEKHAHPALGTTKQAPHAINRGEL